MLSKKPGYGIAGIKITTETFDEEGVVIPSKTKIDYENGSWITYKGGEVTGTEKVGYKKLESKHWFTEMIKSIFETVVEENN